MIEINNEDIFNHTKVLDEHYSQGSGMSLNFESFIKRTLTSIYSEDNQYPRSYKIARSLPEMLRGDLSPERIVTITEPPVLDGIPIWRADSNKGIFLRGLGLQNGDVRYPSTLRMANPNNHAIIGGITGHGKTVLLDSIQIALTMEYPPWEVNLTLADAKITGAMRYAKDPLPHISAIAATTDAEYIISVLDELLAEMNQWNALFGSVGVEKLEDFRKTTGLVVPRKVVVFDEFESAFILAKKRANDIAERFDLVARLGRSAGYILVLCSQNPNAIPSNTLTNITVRMVLGCTEEVSEKIISNKAGAANRNSPGRLVLNTTLEEKDNMHFIVPRIEGPELTKLKRNIYEKGLEVGFSYALSSYNENNIPSYEDVEKTIKKLNPTPSKLFLGEPSFVYRPDDDINMVRIELEKKDMENILIHGGTAKACERQLKLLSYNISSIIDKIVLNVIKIDYNLAEVSGFDKIGNQFEVRSFDDDYFQLRLTGIYIRRLALEVDVNFGNSQTNDYSDELFYEAFERGGPMDNLLNRSRFYTTLAKLHTDFYITAFRLKGLGTGTELREKHLEISKYVVSGFTQWGCAKEKLTIKHLTPIFNVVIGLDRLIGVGRDSNAGKSSYFKKVLQDSFLANVTWIATAVNTEELTDLKVVWSHYLLESITSTQANRVGVVNYPETVGPVLAVLYTKESQKSMKFKKFSLEGELLVNI